MDTNYIINNLLTKFCSNIPMYSFITSRFKALFHTKDGLKIWYRPFRDEFRIIDEVITGIYDRFWNYTPNAEDIIIDGGAHIGCYTIRTAKHCKLIIAVEPEPDNIRLIRKNVAMNGLTNVIDVPAALGDQNKLTKLYISRSAPSHTLFPAFSNHIVIKMVTIDKLVKKLNLPYVSVIKLDVEGVAHLVLKGAETVLRNHAPILIVAAYHNFVQCGCKKFEELKTTIKFLKKLNYKYKFNRGHLFCYKEGN